MALLTKIERRTLTPDQKRKLRKERRAKRRVERDEAKWGKLLARARDLMLELWDDHFPGPEKMDEVISCLADELDELLEWDFLHSLGAIGRALAVAFEAADGPVATALLNWLVRKPLQRLYERLKAEKEGAA